MLWTGARRPLADSRCAATIDASASCWRAGLRQIVSENRISGFKRMEIAAKRALS